MGSLLNCRILNVAGRHYRVLSDPDVMHRLGSNVGRTDHLQTTSGSSILQDQDRALSSRQESTAARSSSENMQEHRQQFEVDNAIVGHILGSKGSKKADIERATGAQVTISSKSRKSTEQATVIIEGSSKTIVEGAVNAVALAIEEASISSRMQPTHFISLPLVSPETSAKMQELKAKILAEPGASAHNIDETIFVDHRTLHLTLAVMKLYTPDKRKKATQVLQGLRSSISDVLNGQPLRLNLQGLKYMKDNAAAIHVLYFDVVDFEQQGGIPHAGLHELRHITSLTTNALRSAGLLSLSDDREVKLHATFLNTKHRKVRGDSGAKNEGKERSSRQKTQPKRVAIDGRELLAKFGTFSLGECTASSMHLSKMHEKAADGYFGCLSAIQLPEPA